MAIDPSWFESQESTIIPKRLRVFIDWYLEEAREVRADESPRAGVERLLLQPQQRLGRAAATVVVMEDAVR